MDSCFLEFTETFWGFFFKAYHLYLKTLHDYQTTVSVVKELRWESSGDFVGRNLILKLIKSVILVLEKKYKNGT